MFKAIAERPWIWIVVAFVVMIAVMAAFVIISIKYAPKEVPVPHSHVDY